jgi:ribonucleotide reductase beta subunit family protein with ferritin-like domain
MNEIDIAEVKCFYGFQIAMENIHSETYSLLIDTYIDDPVEKDRLLNAIETIPIIQKKANWCFKWITDVDSDFIYRLVAFACVEGIFFSSSFCSIYWLKKKGLMPGLTFSNELISRDESLHTEFAILLFHQFKNENNFDSNKIIQMVTEAVELEKEFATYSLEKNLIGMNSGLMGQYIEYVGDRLLVQLGFEKKWNVANPFDFMELISISSKTNFFESRVSQYSKAGVSTGMTSKQSFEVLDDF